MSISIGEINFGAANPNKTIAKAAGSTMEYAANNTRFYNDAQKIATSQGIDMAKAVANMAIPATFAGPVGPAVAMGVGIVAGTFSSIFGSHRAPVYRKPAGFDSWAPTSRDWIVVVEALRYCQKNKAALDNVSKAIPIPVPEYPPTWNTTASALKQRQKIDADLKTGVYYGVKYQIDQLLGLLTKDGSKFLDASNGAKKLDKLVIDGKYAGPNISIRGPRIEGSPVHWFEMIAYTPSERRLYVARDSAIVHACLIQFANALPAQAWMETKHLVKPEPRIAMTKDIPKKDTEKVTGLMPYNWKGNLRFVLSWVEKRVQVAGKWKSYKLKNKGEIERILKECGGVAVTKVLKGRVYTLRPIIVYRAGGTNPDESAGHMVFMEQFGIAQVPGGNARLEAKVKKDVAKAPDSKIKLDPKIKIKPGAKPAEWIKLGVKPSVASLKIKSLAHIADSLKPPTEVKASIPDEVPPAPITAAIETPAGTLVQDTLTPTAVEKTATDAVESASKATGLAPVLIVSGLAIGAILLLKK